MTNKKKNININNITKQVKGLIAKYKKSARRISARPAALWVPSYVRQYLIIIIVLIYFGYAFLAFWYFVYNAAMMMGYEDDEDEEAIFDDDIEDDDGWMYEEILFAENMVQFLGLDEAPDERRTSCASLYYIVSKQNKLDIVNDYMKYTILDNSYHAQKVHMELFMNISLWKEAFENIIGDPFLMIAENDIERLYSLSTQSKYYSLIDDNDMYENSDQKFQYTLDLDKEFFEIFFYNLYYKFTVMRKLKSAELDYDMIISELNHYEEFLEHNDNIFHKELYNFHLDIFKDYLNKNGYTLYKSK